MELKGRAAGAPRRRPIFLPHSAENPIPMIKRIARAVPSEVTLFTGKITIGAKGRAFTEGGTAADGRGIDYFFAAHGEAIVSAYFVARGG